MTVVNIIIIMKGLLRPCLNGSDEICDFSPETSGWLTFSHGSKLYNVNKEIEFSGIWGHIHKTIDMAGSAGANRFADVVQIFQFMKISALLRLRWHGQAILILSMTRLFSNRICGTRVVESESSYSGGHERRFLSGMCEVEHHRPNQFNLFLVTARNIRSENHPSTIIPCMVCNLRGRIS